MPHDTPALAAADLYDQVERFAGHLREVFTRADQHQRFVMYLTGLLIPGGRSNAERIADRVAARPSDGADLRQALQHFLTRSPWDADRLVAACRRMLAAHRPDPPTAWVVHDAVFPKRGRHSVGVYRQFARDRGAKVNCQVGVAVGLAGPAGYTPQAVRLYLPGGWVRDNAGLAERVVPADHRQPRTKGEVALALLDEVAADGRPCPAEVAAEPGYESSPGWDEAVRHRGLTRAADADRRLAEATAGFDALRRCYGLDHFEGRTWAGWHHHVALVYAAYTFRATSADGPARFAPAVRPVGG